MMNKFDAWHMIDLWVTTYQSMGEITTYTFMDEIRTYPNNLPFLWMG